MPRPFHRPNHIRDHEILLKLAHALMVGQSLGNGGFSINHSGRVLRRICWLKVPGRYPAMPPSATVLKWPLSRLGTSLMHCIKKHVRIYSCTGCKSCRAVGVKATHSTHIYRPLFPDLPFSPALRASSNPLASLRRGDFSSSSYHTSTSHSCFSLHFPLTRHSNQRHGRPRQRQRK